MTRRLVFASRLLLALALTTALLRTPLADAAAPTADSPHFSLVPQALYAAASAATVPDGTNVSILEMQETYRFDADGGNVYTQYFVYKVMTPAGVEDWNSLSIRWSPWRDQKPTMRARVIAADGTSYTLDPATITDTSAHSADATIYSDDRVLRAPLPAIAPGAVVETEIVLKESLPFPGAGKVGRSFFQLSEPIQHARLTLQAPPGVTLRHRLDLLPGLAPKRSTADGLESWVFDHGPVAASEDAEPGIPSDTAAYPLISFSTGQSWQALAQAYSKIVSEKLAQAKVADLTARLVKGRATREAQAAAIVEYLNREIRYTGIEFDESSVIPHSPADTLSRKYGDCKDKSILLVAMLNAAGIPANLALLNAGSRLDSPPELPGMGVFDHAIVYVPGEPALWIDATDENARLGQLPAADSGRWALIVAPETTALTRVAEARSRDNVVYEEREIRLADQGPARVVEISKPQGNFESQYRGLYADLKDKRTKDNLTDYVKSEYVAEGLDRLARTDPRDFATPFRLTLESDRAQRGDTGLNEAAAFIPIGGLFDKLPDDLRTREPTEAENAKATRPRKKRETDYQITRPFVAEWHYKIVPPAGFQPSALPPDLTRNLGPATFSEKFTADAEGVVRAELRFDSVKNRFTPAEQSALRNDVAGLLDGETIKVKFELQARVLEARGQSRESFQLYRDLIAQHPKEAIHHLRRADALLQAGMGEAARVEARTAVKLDPKSAFAQETLARILQHDLIGRWHQAGADYAGAKAAYRAAIALDPTDDSLVANHAILLEHNNQGIRYGSGADLTAAIAEYRKLTPQQLSSLGVRSNLAFALFYAHKYEEARAAAEASDSPPIGLLTAAEAQVNGVPKALEQAQRRTADSKRYKEALASAGNLLLNAREYKNAATLVEAGASGTSTAQTLGLASMLRGAARHEDIQYSNRPEDLIRKMMTEVLRPDFAFEQLVSISSRNALLVQNNDPDELDKVRQGGRMLQLTATRAGMHVEALIDITLQSIQIRSAGDDALGYRVVTQIPSSRSMTVFVVKEDGAYKMLDSTEHPGALGLEVLDRLDRNEITGATTLLDWLRESVPAPTGDDRYGTSAFARMWSQDHGTVDAGAIRLAAATVLVQAPQTAQRGITLLEQAKATKPTDAESENIDLALLLGYEQLRDHARAVQTAQALSKRTPTSRRLFLSHSASLRALGRFDEAETLARQRLQAKPDDIDALRVLSANSAAQLRFKEAYERYGQVLTNAGTIPGDLNEMAWLSLFFAREGGPDLETALRGAQLNANYMPLLHTLGCLYAEVGKTREAREVLLQGMVGRGLAEPNGEFWYAFGRIAEQYGEKEIALANYAKVTAPKYPAQEFYSSHALAQNRIKALKARP